MAPPAVRASHADLSPRPPIGWTAVLWHTKKSLSSVACLRGRRSGDDSDRQHPLN